MQELECDTIASWYALRPESGDKRMRHFSPTQLVDRLLHVETPQSIVQITGHPQYKNLVKILLDRFSPYSAL